MNEQIKELILKAGFPKFGEMYVVTDGKELEKFAELIVRECADMFEGVYTDQVIQERIDKRIKQHFGVE